MDNDLDLAREIISKVVLLKGQDGEPLREKFPSSSVSFTHIDEAATRSNMRELVERRKIFFGRPTFIADLKEAVRLTTLRFVTNLDDWRPRAGVRPEDRMTINDILLFAKAAGYCFEYLGPRNQGSSEKIAIGVMAPGVQESGKNLVRIIWQAMGQEVIDLGSKVKTEQWVEVIKALRLRVIGVSLMTNDAVDHFKILLKKIAAEQLPVKVIIGGIAVNRYDAEDFTALTGVQVFYGSNLGDAEAVLLEALGQKKAPVRRLPETPNALLSLADERIRGLIRDAVRFPVSNLVVDPRVAQGCRDCPVEMKQTCPIETGFDKRLNEQESRETLQGYTDAWIINADLPDDWQQRKLFWDFLFAVEDSHGRALALRPPIPCPWCRVDQWELPKGFCRLPKFYRPLPEKFNIDMARTLAKCGLADSLSGMVAVVMLPDGSKSTGLGFGGVKPETGGSATYLMAIEELGPDGYFSGYAKIDGRYVQFSTKYMGGETRICDIEKEYKAFYKGDDHFIGCYSKFDPDTRFLDEFELVPDLEHNTLLKVFADLEHRGVPTGW